MQPVLCKSQFCTPRNVLHELHVCPIGMCCWLFAGSSLYGCVCVCLCVVYNVPLIGAGRAVMFVVLCMHILFLYDFFLYPMKPLHFFFSLSS